MAPHENTAIQIRNFCSINIGADRYLLPISSEGRPKDAHLNQGSVARYQGLALLQAKDSTLTQLLVDWPPT